MRLPKELTTVTPLSKYLALFLLIALPFIGFYLGFKYEETLDLSKPTPTPTTLAIPTVDPSVTVNWKKHMNKDYKFEFKYPSELFVHNEGPWENTKNENWSITLGSIEKSKLKDIINPNTTGLRLQDLYGLSYYSISVYVDNNPVYQAPYSTNKEIVTEKNLRLLLGVPDKYSETTFQNRPAVKNESTFVSGYSSREIGGTIDYFILDGVKVIRLSASSYNLNKIPISYIDQILSTFRFTE